MKIEVYDLDENLTERFIKFCCNELNVYPDEVTVEGWDTPLQNNATGLCFEVNFKSEYLIMVYKKDRTATEIYDTVAHEMIHVKQFVMQNLDKQIQSGESMPIYEDRWWEKEASEKSFSLVKKYVDTLYNMV